MAEQCAPWWPSRVAHLALLQGDLALLLAPDEGAQAAKRAVPAGQLLSDGGGEEPDPVLDHALRRLGRIERQSPPSVI